MNCTDRQQEVFRYLDGELEQNDTQEFETHIAHCDSCRHNLKETKLFWQTVNNVPKAVPSPKLKDSFLDMLEHEKLVNAQRSNTKVVPMYWRTAFQIAASIVLLMGGYMMGTYFSAANNNTQISALEQQKEQLKTDMTLALLENRSASKRIQAVNYSEEIIKPDAKLLQAIIDRMLLDANVNVRLTAAEALSKFSDSELVKKAFIEVLGTEKNPEIQIAVIQYLVRVKEKRAINPMQELLKEPEVPIFVKNQLDKGVQQLL